MSDFKKGFSLVELVIAISVSTILITSLVASLFLLQRGFERAGLKSELINKKSKFFEIISYDVLNPDVFPRHIMNSDETSDSFIFEEKSITFFTNHNKVNYNYTDNKFAINREYVGLDIVSLDVTSDSSDKMEENEDVLEYDFIKDFEVTYFDKDGKNVVLDDEIPYYCVIKFIMDDNKEILLEMRLWERRIQ